MSADPPTDPSAPGPGTDPRLPGETPRRKFGSDAGIVEPMGLTERALYLIGRTILVGFVVVWCRLRVDGKENLPSGTYIVAPTHRSNLDTPAVGAITRRRLRFMGKDTLWKYAWLGQVISAVGGFPVHRGAADRQALRNCIEVLKGGEPLVLFPEGARKQGPFVQDVYEGAAYIAVKAGVPIVPVGIAGSDAVMGVGMKFPRLAPIHVVVGKPIYPGGSSETGASTTRASSKEMTADLASQMQALYDEAKARLERRLL